MIKAALIDLDGTILDSMGMWKTLGKDVLTSLGFTTDEDLNEIFKTFTVNQAAHYYHKHFPTKLTIPDLEKVINTTIEEAYVKKLPLKNGARNFLEKLKEEGVSLALVTTTNSFLAKKALERLKVLDYFNLILSCEDLNCSKNESTIYDKAIEELKVQKKDTLVIEDALHALKTAKDNNYITVGVYDQNVTEQDEIKKLADFYLTDFKDHNSLIELIQEEKL